MFCGSATWRRWKSAPAGNSSVSVSSPRSRRPRLREEARDRDRALAHGVEDAPVPRLGDLLELDGRCLGTPQREGGSGSLRSVRAGGSRRGGVGACAAPVGARLEQLDAMRERLAREVGVRARHLHERELERKPRVGALPRVLDGDREQVDQPQDGRLGELVRLLAEQLLRLLGHGQRVGNVPHVLHEQQVPQVLEQVGRRGGRDPGPAPRAPRRRGARRPCRGRRPCRRAGAATPRRPRRRAAAPTARRSSRTSTPRAGRASTRRRGTSRARRVR